MQCIDLTKMIAHKMNAKMRNEFMQLIVICDNDLSMMGGPDCKHEVDMTHAVLRCAIWHAIAVSIPLRRFVVRFY